MRFIKAITALSLTSLVLAAPSTQPRHDARGVGLPIGGGGADSGLPIVGGLLGGLVGGATSGAGKR